MPTPVELKKCFNCSFFIDIEDIPIEEGLFRYTCSAYPKGIPEDIRCWGADNPSTKPRAHTSVQEGQVGDFVFEQKPPERDLDITVDNILDYQIYDSLGIVGPFATTAELKYFREYVFRLDQYVALKEFLEEGASLITQELTDDIFMLESSDKAIKKMLNVLKKLIDKSDTVMIIGDGS